MSQTPIPASELRVFENLPDIRVVFDVGARTDVDYLRLKPDIELHAFEPKPEYYKELKERVGDNPRVRVNGFGLGEYDALLAYNTSTESVDGSNSWRGESDIKVEVKTLDEYVKTNGITRIDFLKMDTEGNELKILLGGWKAVQMCRFIQYETWNEPHNTFIHRALYPDFKIYHIGHRNMFCVKRGESKPWLPRKIEG